VIRLREFRRNNRGDESILGPIIFCMVLIGSYAFLSNTIPTDFFIPENVRREIQSPNYFESPSIFWSNITDYDNSTITRPSYAEYHLDLFDVDVILWWALDTTIRVDHVWTVFWFFHFNDKIVPDISKDVALSHLSGNLSEFSGACTHETFYFRISFNDSKYHTFSEAWDDGELFFYVGMGYESGASIRSAWSLIGQILFFQIPNVHPLITAIIAIPLWICILVITFTLVTRLFPFGGG
jgi:hypothetical protein